MSHDGGQGVRLPDSGAMAFQLAVGRTVAAGVMMAAPELTLRLIGADGATARRVSWLTRMTAVRDGALGVGALAAVRSGKPASAIPWLLGGAISDTVDAVVLAAARRQGRAKGLGSLLLIPLAAGAAAAGAATAVQLRRGQVSS